MATNQQYDLQICKFFACLCRNIWNNLSQCNVVSMEFNMLAISIHPITATCEPKRLAGAGLFVLPLS